MSDSRSDTKPDHAKTNVKRHSTQRLLRQKLVLPGGIIVSAERRKGRLVVRVELPDDVDKAAFCVNRVTL